jgi:hypothetical protein
MPRTYLYADESGNFDFSGRPEASRYFILTTVRLDDHAICADLLELRRELAWDEFTLEGDFHATTDRQATRDEVFRTIERHTFRIDATVIEKASTTPDVRASDEAFYHAAWLRHMERVVPEIMEPAEELLVIAASVGTRRRRLAFFDAAKRAMRQVSPMPGVRLACWPAATDPALQLADYCSSSIQRKWERSDSRSYELIKSKIATELRVVPQ